MKLRPDIKAYVEAELRDYHQTRKDLVEAKEDIALSGPVLNNLGIVVGAKTNQVGRPTEAKTIAILTNKRIKRMEQVIRAIEVVTGELPEEKTKLVQLKYWQRPRRLTDAGIAMELNIGRRTVYYWAEEICMAIAVELGMANERCRKQA
jgi:RinA family phage transcriptional activator